MYNVLDIKRELSLRSIILIYLEQQRKIRLSMLLWTFKSEATY